MLISWDLKVPAWLVIVEYWLMVMMVSGKDCVSRLLLRKRRSKRAEV
jgi:hypothetical protein